MAYIKFDADTGRRILNEEFRHYCDRCGGRIDRLPFVALHVEVRGGYSEENEQVLEGGNLHIFDPAPSDDLPLPSPPGTLPWPRGPGRPVVDQLRNVRGESRLELCVPCAERSGLVLRAPKPGGGS